MAVSPKFPNFLNFRIAKTYSRKFRGAAAVLPVPNRRFPFAPLYWPVFQLEIRIYYAGESASPFTGEISPHTKTIEVNYADRGLPSLIHSSRLLNEEPRE